MDDMTMIGLRRVPHVVGPNGEKRRALKDAAEPVAVEQAIRARYELRFRRARSFLRMPRTFIPPRNTCNTTSAQAWSNTPHTIQSTFDTRKIQKPISRRSSRSEAIRHAAATRAHMAGHRMRSR